MTLNLIKFIFCFLFSISNLFTVYSRAGRPVFFWNRFRFRTGLSETVPFLNRFIGTDFCLGNRFNPKLRSNLKYFWENWFQICFFNKTGSKTVLVQ
jgi:hypothetical protein